MNNVQTVSGKKVAYSAFKRMLYTFTVNVKTLPLNIRSEKNVIDMQIVTVKILQLNLHSNKCHAHKL